MELTIEAKVVKIGTTAQGESQKGSWIKQELIVETVETYPKTICLQCWNERAEFIKDNVDEGDVYSIDIEVSSREYKGRWYTDVTARDFKKIASVGTETPKEEVRETIKESKKEAKPKEENLFHEQEDDLPF